MVLISVIIPTYNRKTYLLRAIKSVLEQTYSNFEILVMDDGSTDGTVDVIKGINDSRLVYDWSVNWGGPAQPRNRGLKKANGEFIAFLDSDDWWSETKLEESLLNIKQSEADLVYHDLYIVKDKKNITHNDRTRGEDISNKPWECLLPKSCN